MTYTILRLLLFAIPLTVLLLVQVNWVIAVIAAALIGLCVSYLLLRTPRDRVATSLYHASRREKPVPTADDETEDAAVDRAAANEPADRSEPAARSETGGRSEPAGGSEPVLKGERDAEQDAIREAGETGQLQGKDELP